MTTVFANSTAEGRTSVTIAERMMRTPASVRGRAKAINVVLMKAITSLPMLLDILTVFFIVAGCALLWLNLRRRRPRVIITKTDDAHQSAPTRHIPDDVEIRALLAALKPPASETQANPETNEDNAYANRIAEGKGKVKSPPN